MKYKLTAISRPIITKLIENLKGTYFQQHNLHVRKYHVVLINL